VSAEDLTRAPGQRRGRPPTFSRQQFVEAAIAAIEDRGFQAVTMRDVARRLGATSSAVYRHVADKDALLFLAADEIIGSIEVPGDGDAHTRLVGLTMNVRDVLHRYPGVAAYIVHTAPLTPTAPRVATAFLDLLLELGCPPGDAHVVFENLYNLVIGDVIRSRPRAATGPGAVGSLGAGIDALLRGFGIAVPSASQRAHV
jgi:AcrR family transcriptional regulator